MPQDKIGLQPCPFCGSGTTLIASRFDGIPMFICDGCGLVASFRGRHTPALAAADWNKWPYKLAVAMAAIQRLQQIADDISFDNCQLDAYKEDKHSQQSFTNLE